MPDPENRHARVPRIDPEKWEEQPVFRETFMLYVTDSLNAARFRLFSRAQYSMALEGHHRLWDDTFAEAAAEELRAVVGDLRHLQGFLKSSFEQEVETQEDGLMTPRKERLWRFTEVLSKKIEALADEVEEEIQASLQEDDDETEIDAR